MEVSKHIGDITMKTNPLIMSLFLVIVMTAPATLSFADVRECTLRSDRQVKEEKTGASIQLKRGDKVYSRWGEDAPDWMYVVKGGSFEKIAGLQYDALNCGDVAVGSEFPVVLKELPGRAQLYKQFGIIDDPVATNPERDQLPATKNKCFYIGDGFMGMELTDSTFASYKAKSFSLDNICMVLRSGQVRFHPETGVRLPTYVIVDGQGRDASISDELLFQAPSCFARGKLEKSQFGATLKPLGCTVNYHPWSGRKLAPNEVAFFTSQASLQAAGDAGDVKEDSNNLANDPNKQATTARIQAIKSQHVD